VRRGPDELSARAAPGESMFPFYKGRGDEPEAPAPLPSPNRGRLKDPGRYMPDDALVKAVNVALLLGQPLLLTGDPGTGKTQLAYSVSRELGYGDPLLFETKSSSAARDLFYTYDTVARFQAVQTNRSLADRDYLTYNALGLAILYANDRDRVADALPEGFAHPGAKRRSVVLIDEIDKAPRDFPNDILNEVEHMYFKVAELGNRELRAEEDMRPVLIMTSNSEKHLPDAFLRRCVYHHIAFPRKEQLKRIVVARLGQFTDGSVFLDDALNFFESVRRFEGINKKPATAEMLGWLLYLTERGARPDDRLAQHAEEVRASLGVLVKDTADHAALRPAVDGLL
jgi:MoxR-like ATPase